MTTATPPLELHTSPGYVIEPCAHCDQPVTWMATTDQLVAPIHCDEFEFTTLSGLRLDLTGRLPTTRDLGGRLAIPTGQTARSGRNGNTTAVVLILTPDTDIPGPLQHQPRYQVHDWRICPNQDRPAFTIA